MNRTKLKAFLYFSLILGIIGAIFIIAGLYFENKLAVSSGLSLMIPLIFEGLRGKQLKNYRLKRIIRDKQKIQNDITKD